MIVYKSTNKINGKVYIGITTKTLEERIKIHKLDSKDKDFYFYRAIRKYGFESFEWETIDYAKTLDELEEKERYYIEIYGSFNNKEKGYNSTSGGKSMYEITDEERRRRSERVKGDKNPMYGVPSPMKGKTFSDDHRNKISKSLKGSYRQHVIGKNNPSAKRVINLDTGEIFDTMEEAHRKYPKANASAICGVCKGRCKTSGGYRWAYASERN